MKTIQYSVRLGTHHARMIDEIIHHYDQKHGLQLTSTHIIKAAIHFFYHDWKRESKKLHELHSSSKNQKMGT